MGDDYILPIIAGLNIYEPYIDERKSSQNFAIVMTTLNYGWFKGSRVDDGLR